MKNNPGILPQWILPALLWCTLLHGSLALGQRASWPGPYQTDSVLYRALGGLRGGVASEMVLQADRYFHRGVSPETPEFARTWLSRWADALQPSGHVHLESTEATAEMMPWMRAATELAPEDVETALLAAYWMERADPDIGRAEMILREAQQAHPEDYRVSMEMARFEFRYKRLESGDRWLKRAVSQWPGPLSAQDGDAVRDGVYLWQLSGLVHAYHGRVDQAILFMERAAQAPSSLGNGARRDLEQLRTHPESFSGNEKILARFVRQAHIACEDNHEHEH